MHRDARRRACRRDALHRQGELSKAHLPARYPLPCRGTPAEGGAPQSRPRPGCNVPERTDGRRNPRSRCSRSSSKTGRFQSRTSTTSCACVPSMDDDHRFLLEQETAFPERAEKGGGSSSCTASAMPLPVATSMRRSTRPPASVPSCRRARRRAKLSAGNEVELRGQAGEALGPLLVIRAGLYRRRDALHQHLDLDAGRRHIGKEG